MPGTPTWRALDPSRIRLRCRFDHIHGTESLRPQGRKGAVQLPVLAAHRMWGHGPRAAATQALEADLHGQVEHDCYCGAPLLASDVE